MSRDYRLFLEDRLTCCEEILWDIVQNHIPRLQQQLGAILAVDEGIDF
jgi:uncharacterized protein with HEPN domain